MQTIVIASVLADSGETIQASRTTCREWAAVANAFFTAGPSDEAPATQRYGADDDEGPATVRSASFEGQVSL